MFVESYGISDIGLKRHNNEDAWGEIPAHHFYVLADGMGGHQAGEVASKETIDALLKAVPALFSTPTTLSLEELSIELQEIILETNSWIYHLSKENPDWQGMGTTLCCLLLYQNHAIYAHVGDSRIYRYRGTLKLLTQDHSLRREVAKRYHLKEHQGHLLPSKHVITRAIGTSSRVEPECNLSEIKAGDIYFLCSDGLTDVVDEEEITHILETKNEVKEACTALIQTALAHGGQDNITLVMVKVL